MTVSSQCRTERQFLPGVAERYNSQLSPTKTSGQSGEPSQGELNEAFLPLEPQPSIIKVINRGEKYDCN